MTYAFVCFRFVVYLEIKAWKLKLNAMLTYLIPLLLSMGVFDSAEDFFNLSTAEQNTLLEIVIVDEEIN